MVSASPQTYDYGPPFGYIFLTSAVLFILALVCFYASYDKEFTLTLLRVIELGNGRSATAMFIAAVLFFLIGVRRVFYLFDRFLPMTGITLRDGELTFPKLGILFTRCDSFPVGDLEFLGETDVGGGRRLTVRSSSNEARFDSLWFVSPDVFDEFSASLSELRGVPVESANDGTRQPPRRRTIW